MRTVSEHDIQVMLVKWFDLAYKPYRGRLFAIPNGGQRNIIVATKLKAEGVRKGVPDLMLPVPAGGFSGLFIELKAAKRPATTEQNDWIEYLNAVGYCAIICHGFDAAKAAIDTYFSEC